MSEVVVLAAGNLVDAVFLELTVRDLALLRCAFHAHLVEILLRDGEQRFVRFTILFDDGGGGKLVV